MFVILGLASLLLGVGSHKNAFPELYLNDEKRGPIRFKYSLTLFVEGKGWILSGMVYGSCTRIYKASGVTAR